MISQMQVGKPDYCTTSRVFSGLGVAVSLFDDQMASLCVGVTISASLLPPAVNSGIVAMAAHFFAAQKNLPQTTMVYASVSMECLTISNIILIWISSMFMFCMKEVLPIKKSIFWSDLGIARKSLPKEGPYTTKQGEFK